MKSWQSGTLDPLPTFSAMRATMLVFATAMAFTSPAAAAGKELFHLDFNDPANLAKQPDPLPAGRVLEDAKASSDFPGSVNLGSSGSIMVPGFVNPQGPFSVEARFRLKDYGLQNTRFITDIFNTATWDTVVTQGVVLRIGGGYLYAPLPASAYETTADYQANIAWYADDARASVSKCIGEFTTAIKGDTRAWKEVVTDRCISRNTWVHMVGVWDGEDMHIYLNGLSALDSLRILSKSAVPNFEEVSTAFVGARTYGNYDARHFNGDIDFVRVVDTAMSPMEIKERFRATQTTETGEPACHGVLEPEYPTPGQAVNRGTKYRCRIVPDGACTDPDFKPVMADEDSIEVEIGGDSDFGKVLVRTKVKDMEFTIEDDKVLSESDYQGGAYWRARIKHASPSQGLGKRSAEALPEWSLSRPLMLDIKKATVGLGKSTPASHSRVLAMPGMTLRIPAQGSRVPGLWSLAGVSSSIAWVKTGSQWMAEIPRDQQFRLLILGWK